MRRLTIAVLALVTVLLFALPVASASAEPTLNLEKDCTVPNGVRPSLSGFPPNTPFHGTIVSPFGTTNQGDFTTDANGEFSIGSFSSPVPGVWTATVEWSGGTLVETLDVRCPIKRMVGKGSLTSGAATASYAYIVGCPATGNAPFEIRIGGGSFRLRPETAFVTCSDDPNVPTPAAGFDTQVGTGVVRAGIGADFDIEWKFVDAGPGGANDSARITIKLSGLVFFDGTASPPGKFPGSTQTTGYNTAQLLP